MSSDLMSKAHAPLSGGSGPVTAFMGRTAAMSTPKGWHGAASADRRMDGICTMSLKGPDNLLHIYPPIVDTACGRFASWGRIEQEGALCGLRHTAINAVRPTRVTARPEVGHEPPNPSGSGAALGCGHPALRARA